MIELVLPSAHPSAQPKRRIDCFSHFCMAQGRMSSGMPGHVLSTNNYPFPYVSVPHLVHASLRPSESITQTTSQSVQPFLHRSWQSVAILYSGPPLPSHLKLPFLWRVPVLYIGTPLPTLKIAPSYGGSGPHLIRCSLGS